MMRRGYEAARSVGRLDRLGGCQPHWQRAPAAHVRWPKEYRNGYAAGWYSVADSDAGTQLFWRTDAERRRGTVEVLRASETGLIR